MAPNTACINALQFAGYFVMQITYEQIALHPDNVVADVLAALAHLDRAA